LNQLSFSGSLTSIVHLRETLMRNPDANGKTGIQDKAELALHLWEGLVRELVERRIIDGDALDRVLAGVSPPDGGDIGRLRDEIGARLAQALPTPLQLADRDGVPDTED
jgi:hypothetical protein